MTARARGQHAGRGPAAWLTALLVLCLLSGIGISAEHSHDGPGEAVPCAVCHIGQAADVPETPAVAAVALTAEVVEQVGPQVLPATPAIRRVPPARGPPLVV